MMNIRIIVAITIILGFSPAKSKIPSDIQNKLMDLSGLNIITSIPKLETTDQRNQFFDNYSALSIPDVKDIDQSQLQSIQTFTPSHRKVNLDDLGMIEVITSGLSAKDITVRRKEFKDVSIQNGKIVVPDMDNKSQQVKDILEAANAVLKEVISLNQKELNSLKLTISDMKNIQKVVPMIRQQLNQPVDKDGKMNRVSVDVDAMIAEMNNARKEALTLLSILDFSDFNHLINADTPPNGKLIFPNYNKDTASDNLNKFIKIANQTSKYIDAGLLSNMPPLDDFEAVSNLPPEAKEWVASLKGKSVNMPIHLDTTILVSTPLSTPVNGGYTSNYNKEEDTGVNALDLPPYAPIVITPVFQSPERDFSKIFPIDDERRVIDCPGSECLAKPIPIIPGPIFPGPPIPGPIFPGPIFPDPILPPPEVGPCAGCGVPDFPSPPIIISTPDLTFDYMPGVKLGTFEPFSPYPNDKAVQVTPLINITTTNAPQ